MNKLFTMIGGRKFALTVVSMIGATAIDLLAGGISLPLATFLGAALTAFCASNWLNSREYYHAEAEKKKGGAQDLAQIQRSLKEIKLKLDSSDDAGYYVNSLEQINQALKEIITAQANIMQTTKATNNTINAAMQVGQR